MLTPNLPLPTPRDEDLVVDVATAQKLLQVKSIEQEFKALQKRVVASQFQYLPAKSAQALRPYQIEASATLKDMLKKRYATVVVQLPTGAGKTYFIHWFMYQNLLKKNKNVLVITPSWEIANQHAMTMCQGFIDGSKRVRRLGGDGQLIANFAEYKKSDQGKVIITTSALFYAREEKLTAMVKAGLVVIDEGHHGWRKKRLNSVQAFAREVGAPTVLLTATPPLNMEILAFAAQLKYLDLVPEYLVPCEVLRLDTGETFNPVVKNGLLSQKSRVEISSRRQRFEKIVSDSIPHLTGQTIYYAGSVVEAIGVVQSYRDQGIKATVVHSQWASKGDKINALAIERFRTGKAQVLVNVQMLAMGFDVPNVETIIVARPVESDTLFTQMVGRGARPSAGKTKFTLIDVHDTISKPEVAKIFEHHNIFYRSTTELPVDLSVANTVAEVQSTQDFSATTEAPLVAEAPKKQVPPRALTLLPQRAPEVAVERAGVYAFELLRSQLVVDYFLAPDKFKSVA